MSGLARGPATEWPVDQREGLRGVGAGLVLQHLRLALVEERLGEQVGAYQLGIAGEHGEECAQPFEGIQERCGPKALAMGLFAGGGCGSLGSGGSVGDRWRRRSVWGLRSVERRCQCSWRSRSVAPSKRMAGSRLGTTRMTRSRRRTSSVRRSIPLEVRSRRR